MKREFEVKKHGALLDAINELRKERHIKLKSKRAVLNNREAFLRAKKSSFSIDWEIDISSQRGKLDVGTNFKNVHFSIGSMALKIENLLVTFRSSFRFSGNIGEFRTTGFSPKSHYYYQLVIPLDKELLFHENIQDQWFSTDLGWKSRTSTFAFSGKKKLMCSL